MIGWEWRTGIVRSEDYTKFAKLLLIQQEFFVVQRNKK